MLSRSLLHCRDPLLYILLRTGEIFLAYTYVAESIELIAWCYGNVGLHQLCTNNPWTTKLCTELTKAYMAETSCNQLSLILLRVWSRSVYLIVMLQSWWNESNLRIKASVHAWWHLCCLSSPTQLSSTCRMFLELVDWSTSILPVHLPAVLTLHCSALWTSLDQLQRLLRSLKKLAQPQQ